MPEYWSLYPPLMLLTLDNAVSHLALSPAVPAKSIGLRKLQEHNQSDIYC
jgi:hypothetical protein